MIKDNLNIYGKFIATLIDPKTGLVTLRKESNNVITSEGKNLIARMLLEISGYNTGLTYHAVGTGTASVTVRDSELDIEVVRKPILVHGDTTTNIAAFFTFFAAADITIEIEEVGIFGHSTATGTSGSGILFARALLNIDNTGGQDLNLSYVLTVD